MENPGTDYTFQHELEDYVRKQRARGLQPEICFRKLTEAFASTERDHAAPQPLTLHRDSPSGAPQVPRFLQKAEDSGKPATPMVQNPALHARTGLSKALPEKPPFQQRPVAPERTPAGTGRAPPAAQRGETPAASGGPPPRPPGQRSGPRPGERVQRGARRPGRRGACRAAEEAAPGRGVPQGGPETRRGSGGARDPGRRGRRGAERSRAPLGRERAPQRGQPRARRARSRGTCGTEPSPAAAADSTAAILSWYSVIWTPWRGCIK